MPDKVTYYAIVNDLSSRERPAGVFRRTYTEDGWQASMKHLPGILCGSTARLWSPPSVATCENKFIEITEGEANQIVARIRAKVTGTSNA